MYANSNCQTYQVPNSECNLQDHDMVLEGQYHQDQEYKRGQTLISLGSVLGALRMRATY